MKMWVVEGNTGDHAHLLSGRVRKIVDRPKQMSIAHFYHWLYPESEVDEVTLRNTFNT
jgi:hypothetical protein